MSSPGRGTVDRAGYYDYIQSPEWAAVKARYRSSKLPQTCQAVVAINEAGKLPRDRKVRCNQRVVDLHHRTYKNLGNEYLRDLIPLCREHHDEVHEHQEASGDHLWGATKHVTTAKRLRRKPNPLPSHPSKRGYGPRREDGRRWDQIWTTRCPKCGSIKQKCLGLNGRQRRAFHAERTHLVSSSS